MPPTVRAPTLHDMYTVSCDAGAGAGAGPKLALARDRWE